jgi:single-stranded-DNA-specific exonuclease
LRENSWNGQTNIELEIVGVRQPTTIPANNTVKKAAFAYEGKSYTCSLWESLNELRIRNDQGKVLAVNKGQRTGLLGTNRENAKEVDVTQKPFYQIIKTALKALE